MLRRSISGFAALVVSLVLGVRPAAPADAPPAWEPAKTWALLVGVLSWEDPNLAPFPVEKRQDRVLEQVLLDRGVPRDHLTFLEDEEATLEKVREELGRTADAAGSGSTLILYFAGHGMQRGKRTWFANRDARTEDVDGTAWSLEEIGGVLAERWHGRRLIVLADACHSGALHGVVDMVGKRADVEAVSVTSALDCNVSTGAWTFTEALVAGFRGDARLDRDDDGRVSFGELDLHVVREMRFRASQLTAGHRSASFDPRTVLAQVDPATRRGVAGGRWRVGDFAEAQWKEKWWRVEVLDAEKERWKVHYLGFEAAWDEWLQAARLRAPTPLARTKGEAVEIEWKKKWWPGAILDVRDDFALVHYDGFGDEWDEWVTAKRLRARTER
jgi:hypothetical protein